MFLQIPSADLLTDKGIIGVLSFFILCLLAVVKVLWDAWRKSESEKYSLGREVIQLLNKNELIAENDRESFKEIKESLASDKLTLIEIKESLKDIKRDVNGEHR